MPLESKPFWLIKWLVREIFDRRSLPIFCFKCPDYNAPNNCKDKILLPGFFWIQSPGETNLPINVITAEFFQPVNINEY